MVRLTATIHEFTEILVVGNEDSSFTYSPGQDVQIVGFRHSLSNCKHVVTEATEVPYHRYAGGLINEEL